MNTLYNYYKGNMFIIFWLKNDYLCLTLKEDEHRKKN